VGDPPFAINPDSGHLRKIDYQTSFADRVAGHAVTARSDCQQRAMLPGKPHGVDDIGCPATARDHRGTAINIPLKMIRARRGRARQAEQCSRSLVRSRRSPPSMTAGPPSGGVSVLDSRSISSFRYFRCAAEVMELKARPRNETLTPRDDVLDPAEISPVLGSACQPEDERAMD
jgi:hypothetical protein